VSAVLVTIILVKTMAVLTMGGDSGSSSDSWW